MNESSLYIDTEDLQQNTELETTADDMALSLNPDDKQWIKKTVQQALKDQNFETQRPSFVEFARLWGAPALAIAVALFVWDEHTKYVEFRTHTNDKLGDIVEKLSSLRAIIAANQPTKPQNQIAARELIEEAKQKRIPALPVSTVAEAGRSFVGAAPGDAGAWKTAISFVNYKTLLNASEKPSYQLSTLREYDSPDYTTYQFNAPIGGKRGILRAYGTAPLGSQQQALLESIQAPIQQTSRVGNAMLMLLGGQTLIDGHHLRHVILEGVEVHYNGSPAILEDVLFINCTFVMDNNTNGRSLGDAILASTKVSVNLNG